MMPFKFVVDKITYLLIRFLSLSSFFIRFSIMYIIVKNTTKLITTRMIILIRFFSVSSRLFFMFEIIFLDI